MIDLSDYDGKCIYGKNVVMAKHMRGEELTSEERQGLDAYVDRLIPWVRKEIVPAQDNFAFPLFSDRQVTNVMRPSIKGRRVIELGPCDVPLLGWSERAGATEYVGVELFYAELTKRSLESLVHNVVQDGSYEAREPEIPASVVDDDDLSYLMQHEIPASVVDDDALHYLMQQPDESAIVISGGVICPELLNYEGDDYYRLLAKEIYRVTPKGETTMHITLNGNEFLREVGFKKELRYVWLKE